MKITFLGTGTSQGVPVIGCRCVVCTSADKRDKRFRTSAWIHTATASIVIDSGPDFRSQMLRADVRRLDAIFFTHGHKDHTAGLDDVRAYNHMQRGPVDVYADDLTQEVLRREFAYIFKNPHYPGVPQINLKDISADSAISVNELVLHPIPVMHYKLQVYGFRMGDLTYITDANYIAPEQLEKIKGSKIFVLNALRQEQHISHYSLAEAIEIAKIVNAQHTYFTHISHQLGLHNEIDNHLPPNMHLAYDGLTIEL